VFAFHDRDHGDASEGPLRGYVEDLLRRAGLPVDGGRIALLCMPRIFGFVFNPLSIYYCYDAAGSAQAIIYALRRLVLGCGSLAKKSSTYLRSWTWT
jgi:DUF1365 family protein